MANEGYHEPIEELSDETRDMHRAITSLMEELEAVDWYNQRVDACKDAELKAILAHNRDEEKEHAAMVLEWIRRRDTVLDKELKDCIRTGNRRPLRHTRRRKYCRALADCEYRVCRGELRHPSGGRARSHAVRSRTGDARTTRETG